MVIWQQHQRKITDAYRAAAISRLVGTNPPAAAQFNTSRQFVDVIEQGLLNNVDETAAREHWDTTLPEPISLVVRSERASRVLIAEPGRQTERSLTAALRWLF